MTEEEKQAVHSAIRSGEIEKFSEEFFRKSGQKGGKNRWKGKTQEEIDEEMRKVRQGKFSTD